MASIFDALKGFITGGDEGKRTSGKLSDFLEKNSKLINQVLADILEPYFDVKSGKKRDISKLISLLEPNVCSQMMIFLSKNLEQQLDSYNVGNLGSNIAIFNATSNKSNNPGQNNLVSKLKEKSIDAGNGLKVSKQDLCDTIAVHYVKILNLLASILVALDPSSNLCLARINNLYTLVESPNEGQAFQVGICTDKSVIKSRLLEEPGIREFLQLYMYHMIRETETEAEKRAVLNEYAILAKLFDDLGIIESSSQQNQNNNESHVTSGATEAEPNTTDMMELNVDFPTNEPPIIPNTAEASEDAPQELDLSSQIRRLNNKLKELENSQKQARINKNSELRGEIGELKHTIGELMELVKKGKATPDNIEHKLGMGNRVAETSATFNTENTSQIVKQSNVNKLEPYDNGSESEQWRPSNKFIKGKYTSDADLYSRPSNKYIYGNNSSELSKKRLSDLESKLVKLISKINNNNNKQHGKQNTTSENIYNQSSYGYQEPTMSNNYNEVEQDASHAYNMPIYNQNYDYPEQQGGAATSIYEEQQFTPNNNAPNTSNRSKSFNKVSKSINQFREFMEKYTKDKPDIRKQFFAVFDSKFRSPKPEKIERICTNAKSVGKPFSISISEASENLDIKQFVDNFKAMRAEYMDNASKLVDILESRLLEQYTNDQQQLQYRVRDISGAGLKEIETMTRQTLADLYGKCHRRYLEGINYLDSYFFNKIKQTDISSI